VLLSLMANILLHWPVLSMNRTLLNARNAANAKRVSIQVDWVMKFTGSLIKQNILWNVHERIFLEISILAGWTPVMKFGRVRVYAPSRAAPWCYLVQQDSGAIAHFLLRDRNIMMINQKRILHLSLQKKHCFLVQKLKKGLIDSICPLK